MPNFYGGINLDGLDEIPQGYREILSIGRECIIGSNCVLAGNGFGYEKGESGFIHKEHKYGVIIRDNVIIHPNCTIDRGRWRHTTIGKGTRIDANTHIAHNVLIGENVMIGSGCQILGSVEIRDNATIWSGSIIHQGVTVGRGAVVGAGTYLREDVPDKTQVYQRRKGLTRKRLL